MFYSCAYFRNDDETLEAAQINKCRLIAAKLDLKPGMKVLDIGSGWGGLARYLAQIADVDVIGRDAVEGAVSRWPSSGPRRPGLEGRVEFELQDYRQLDQQVRPHRLGRHVRACRRRATTASSSPR